MWSRLSRDADRARASLGAVEAFSWVDPKGERPPGAAFAGADGVVHLLGEPIAQRWSDEAKAEIRDSRLLPTHNLVDGLATLGDRPPVLVSQSATGWYGPRGDERLDESEPAGDDFLATVTRGWEHEARRAESIAHSSGDDANRGCADGVRRRAREMLPRPSSASAARLRAVTSTCLDRARGSA